MSRRNKSLSGKQMENLEARRMLSTVQVNHPDFSSTSDLVTNGFGSNAFIAGSPARLRMTDNGTSEHRSVWFNTAVPIGNFGTDIVFRPQGNLPMADGFTFCVQNQGTNAVGLGGEDLGYKNLTTAVCAAFNFYNGNTGGSEFGVQTDGDTPATDTDMSPIDLHSGHLFKAQIRYDGTNLTVTVSDLSNKTDVFSTSVAVDIPTVVGGDTAFVGITAATGATSSFQDVTAWTYSGSSAAPTVATAAHATPSPVTGSTAAMAVLGADGGGESGLTYTWSLGRAPAGAPTPTFSTNGSNSAKNTTATFFKDGSYRLNCTITNGDGVSTVSSALVDVSQTATGIRLAPHAAHIAKGATQQFTGTVLDQFNHAFRTQPTLIWAVTTGTAGTINASTGVFTASSSAGTVLVTATDADDLLITGSSGAKVV